MVRKNVEHFIHMREDELGAERRHHRDSVRGSVYEGSAGKPGGRASIRGSVGAYCRPSRASYGCYARNSLRTSTTGYNGGVMGTGRASIKDVVADALLNSQMSDASSGRTSFDPLMSTQQRPVRGGGGGRFSLRNGSFSLKGFGGRDKALDSTEYDEEAQAEKASCVEAAPAEEAPVSAALGRARTAKGLEKHLQQARMDLARSHSMLQHEEEEEGVPAAAGDGDSPRRRTVGLNEASDGGSKNAADKKAVIGDPLAPSSAAPIHLEPSAVAEASEENAGAVGAVARLRTAGWCGGGGNTRGQHRLCMSGGGAAAGLSALRTPTGLTAEASGSSNGNGRGGGNGGVSFQLPSGASSGSVLSASQHPLKRSQRESAAYGGMWDEEHFDMEEAEEHLSPLEALAAKQDHADRRRRLVRNRWQLYLMLYRNPILQGYRAHALAVMAAGNLELKERVKAEEEKERARKPPIWKRLPWMGVKAAKKAAVGAREISRKAVNERRPRAMPMAVITESCAEEESVVSMGDVEEESSERQPDTSEASARAAAAVGEDSMACKV